MKRWCVRHNQACDYANSGGDCNVSACQTVIGGDRKMTKREQLIEKAKSAINNMNMSDKILAHIFSDVMFSDVISCKCCPMFGKCGTGCFDVLYQWLKDHGDEEIEK